MPANSYTGRFGRLLPSRPQSRWALLAAATVAGLTLSALYVERQRRRVEAENPPAGRFVDVDGTRLHYTVHGQADAPALVLLHGIGSMGQEIELSGLVELAARQFRVFVFDRPGYGHSPRVADPTPQAQANLFLHALSELGIERPIVVAHSWATLVAQAMALQSPASLKGVVLMGGYYTPSLRLDVLFNSLPAVPVIGPLLAHTVSPLWARLIWRATTWRMFSPAPRELREGFRQRYPAWMSLRPSALRTAASETSMLIPQALRLRLQQPDTHLPVVIVAGANDRLLSPNWHSQRAEGHWPNSRVHLVPQAGHMVHHAAPQAVLEAIREVSSMVTPEAPVPLDEPPQIAPEDQALQQQFTG
ncbi:MAG: alpha/beta hydrolase [Aquabacterium sp.]